MPLIKTLKLNALLLIAGFVVLAVSAVGTAVAVKETGTKETGTTSVRQSASAKTVIEHATDLTFEKQVLRSRGPVLVDFYADWCGPCRVQGAILKEFASEFRKGKIVKINVDKSPKLAERYGVQGLPTLMLFQDGKAIAEQVGVATKRQLRAALLGDGPRQR